MTDEVDTPANSATRAASFRAFDRCLAAARAAFADMTPDDLDALINEAVAAARGQDRGSPSVAPDSATQVPI